MADLMSPSCIPFTDVAGKSLEECNSVCCLNSSEKRVHVMLGAAEMGPVRPISQPHFLSLIHDPIESVPPRKSVKTFETILVCSRSSSHE